MVNKFDVIECYHAHADWTSRDIARELRCSDGYVRATLQRNDLPTRKLPRVVISAVERAEREQDHRDLDMLSDIAQGHDRKDVAKFWGVSIHYINRMLKHVRDAA